MGTGVQGKPPLYGKHKSNPVSKIMTGQKKKEDLKKIQDTLSGLWNQRRIELQECSALMRFIANSKVVLWIPGTRPASSQ